jgi:hypothetical protein
LGIRILRIVKIGGQEPTYRLELEKIKVAIPRVDKLVGQHSLRMAIASAVEHLIPKFRHQNWDRIAQMLLNAVTVEDGGDETDLVGSARLAVEDYLTNAHFIDPEEDLTPQNKFKPAIFDGQVAISAQDLTQYINVSGHDNRAPKDVVAMLSALGAISHRPKRTKLRDQSRWLLPVDKFPPDQYSEAYKEEADAKSSGV